MATWSLPELFDGLNAIGVAHDRQSRILQAIKAACPTCGSGDYLDDGSNYSGAAAFRHAKPDRAAQTGKEFEKVFLTSLFDEMMKERPAQSCVVWRAASRYCGGSFMVRSPLLASLSNRAGFRGSRAACRRCLDAYGQGKSTSKGRANDVAHLPLWSTRPAPQRGRRTDQPALTRGRRKQSTPMVAKIPDTNRTVC